MRASFSIRCAPLSLHQFFLNHWGAQGGKPHDHFSDEPVPFREGSSDGNTTALSATATSLAVWCR